MIAALMSFWPAFAAGAIAIPVIIHLINSKRYKIVPWAAMRFLLAAQKQTRKRMRIEQLILLLVRILILALILFAMISVLGWAEQIWAAMELAQMGQAKQPQQRTHHLFVLDASLSMNQKIEGGQSAFEIARQLAMKKIADSPVGDGYSVLILKDNPVWLIGEAAQDGRKVTRELEKVRSSHGNAAVPSMLNMVAAKLGEASPRFPAQAVYFFTDMQQSTWAGAAPSDLRTEAESEEKKSYLEIQKRATTVFVDCGPRNDVGNLAVTHVEFDLNKTPYVTTGTDLTLIATLKNYGNEERRDVRAELLKGRAKGMGTDPPLQMRVDGHWAGSIPANGQIPIVFKNVRFDKPGTYAVQVKIAGGDVLQEDDARTIIITVRDTVPVLLVNGKASADRFERATEYLRLALNPFPAGERSRMGFPLRPTVVTPGRSADMTEADLEIVRLHLLVRRAASSAGPELRKIDGHLRRGGGLVVTLRRQGGARASIALTTCFSRTIMACCPS